ncbi:hypothetical protein, partial [Streptomyces sp. e14]|uniref:hypothetical protein n=1 Tax=Streptomyces sp. e14 TaxID=645465 RepID=UPI001E49C305
KKKKKKKHHSILKEKLMRRKIKADRPLRCPCPSARPAHRAPPLEVPPNAPLTGLDVSSGADGALDMGQ